MTKMPLHLTKTIVRTKRCVVRLFSKMQSQFCKPKVLIIDIINTTKYRRMLLHSLLVLAIAPRSGSCPRTATRLGMETTRIVNRVITLTIKNIPPWRPRNPPTRSTQTTSNKRKRQNQRLSSSKISTIIKAEWP